MIQIGIVGCGMFAGAHARKLAAMPEARIVALCSRSESSIANLVERRLTDYQPTPSRYTSTREMYENEDLDGVVIITPHNLHFEQASEVLEAGCHVLLEKPMVTNVSDAYALAEKVESAGKILAVGYNTSYTPAFAYVRNGIRSGRFGTLARGYYLHPGHPMFLCLAHTEEDIESTISAVREAIEELE